jgi:hypothetical protein
MKKLFLLLALVVLFEAGKAQKILVLDVNRLGMFNRHRFTAGDQLCFKLKDGVKRHYATITGFGDSMIIAGGYTIPIKDIRIVYYDKSNFLTRMLSKAGIIYGIGFPGLDIFNNIINEEPQIIKKEALLEGACFTFSGLVLRRMMLRKYHLNSRNSLKIIDITPG